MVEQNPVAGVHAVGFTVVDRDPVRVKFGASIGRTGIEGRFLGLRHFPHQTEQLGCGCLIKTRMVGQRGDADGFQQTQCAQGIHIRRVFRRFKRNLHMALGRQIIDFVRLYFLHDTHEVAGIAEVAVMQNKMPFTGVRILVQVIYAIRIEEGCPAFDAMNFIALAQQKFREIRAVLPGNAGDESLFHDRFRCLLCGCGTIRPAPFRPYKTRKAHVPGRFIVIRKQRHAHD